MDNNLEKYINDYIEILYCKLNNGKKNPNQMISFESSIKNQIQMLDDIKNHIFQKLIYKITAQMINNELYDYEGLFFNSYELSDIIILQPLKEMDREEYGYLMSSMADIQNSFDGKAVFIIDKDTKVMRAHLDIEDKEQTINDI